MAISEGPVIVLGGEGFTAQELGDSSIAYVFDTRAISSSHSKVHANHKYTGQIQYPYSPDTEGTMTNSVGGRPDIAHSNQPSTATVTSPPTNAGPFASAPTSQQQRDKDLQQEARKKEAQPQRERQARWKREQSIRERARQYERDLQEQREKEQQQDTSGTPMLNTELESIHFLQHSDVLQLAPQTTFEDAFDIVDEDVRKLVYLDGGVVFESLRPIHTSGGFCDVFVGRHPKHGRVALKQPRILGIWTLENQKVCIRFGCLLCYEPLIPKREVRFWKTLNHPAVVPFLGVYKTGTDIYMVSPYLRNGNLTLYLRVEPEAPRCPLVRR